METSPSNYNQASFIGGMYLLGDDSRLQSNQYRIGFNLTNRFDELDLIPSSILDTSAPTGPKQGILTFGNYVILFCGGKCYYRAYNAIGWVIIQEFQMSPSAPRYWTCPVPISLTNFVRYAATNTFYSSNGNVLTSTPSVSGPISIIQVAGAAEGNLPGLIVQDNINQPFFLYLDDNGFPQARQIQKYSQWSINFTDGTGNTVMQDLEGNPMDYREYVPIGNCMAWSNGQLFVVDPTFNFIYQSVIGRPLDFVVNVTNALPNSSATRPPYIPPGVTIPSGPYFTQLPGGPASTTSYSVGVGGISCIRPMTTGGIFVSASGANFNVSQNQTPNAPTTFGQYTFNRVFLFNAFCLSDRAILDTLGDTRFIDLGGIRSFNAIASFQNEGRNSVFSNSIQAVFGISPNAIIQDPANVACVLYDNYELYSVETIFGAAIAKFDTVNGVWTSFDIEQTPGKRIKQFAALQINVLALFGITEDDKVYQFYASATEEDTGLFRTVGICSTLLYANYDIKMNNPNSEIKPQKLRIIMNKITENCEVTASVYVNNCITAGPTTKKITYQSPAITIDDEYTLPDVNTQLTNVLFPLPNVNQGWKTFGVISWTDGVITQYSMELENLTPQNPLSSQGLVK
jgi:hypothetical protein